MHFWLQLDFKMVFFWWIVKELDMLPNLRCFQPAVTSAMSSSSQDWAISCNDAVELVNDHKDPCYRAECAKKLGWWPLLSSHIYQEQPVPSSCCYWTAFHSYDFCDSVRASNRNEKMQRVKHAGVPGDHLLLPSHWQDHRLTLLCILNCAAHLLPMPEEVEMSFFNQTIKVFTKVNVRKRCLMNALNCVFVYVLICPAGFRSPQRRTSVCTQLWKRSWRPSFMSCASELWRRMTTPDPASAGPLRLKQGSTRSLGHYCIWSQFLVSCTAVICQSLDCRDMWRLSFEGLVFCFLGSSS